MESVERPSECALAKQLTLSELASALCRGLFQDKREEAAGLLDAPVFSSSRRAPAQEL